MERKKCEILGLRTEYLTTNSPAEELPLVILHGWGSKAERWSAVLLLLEKRGKRAIAVDLPGFGKSEAPREPWGLENYQQFVIEFLKELNTQKFYLLGHSFGGRIAIKIAAAGWSGLVKLILVNSAGVTPRSKARISIYMLATKIVKPIFSIPPLNIFRNLTRKIIYTLSGSYDYYLAKGAMKKTFNEVIVEDLTPYLPSIQLPTCVIWGKLDNMTPVSDAYVIHNHIKNSKLTIIENGDHSLHLQMPEQLVEEIIKCI